MPYSLVRRQAGLLSKEVYFPHTLLFLFHMCGVFAMICSGGLTQVRHSTPLRPVDGTPRVLRQPQKTRHGASAEGIYEHR